MKKCIFLGFDKGVKGYKLWDQALKKKVLAKQGCKMRWGLYVEEKCGRGSSFEIVY